MFSAREHVDVGVDVCCSALLGFHQKPPSIPVLSLKYGEGDSPASKKRKKRESNNLGSSFLHRDSLLFLLLYLFSQQTPSVHSRVLHLTPQADLSSIWLPLVMLPTAPYNAHLSLCRSNFPACPSMNVARCFAEEGFVTLINVPLLYSPEETLLCLQTQSCLYSPKPEKSEDLTLPSLKSNQWLI